MSLEFTEKELAAIRSEYCKGATDAQFDLFVSECKARNLRPGVHLVFQLRRAKEYDPTVGAYVYVQKPYWITTIAALRLIAQRTGDYLGQGPEEYIYLDESGNPTVRSEFPLPHEDPKQRPLPREPWVARATVYRKGFNQPMIGMARFEAYATVVVPKEGAPYLSETWRKRGSEQLFKCAEALALRRAYPEEMAGLLLQEELKDEIAEEPQIASPSVSAALVPLPPSAPKVDQTPATPTDAPRPGEVKVEYHVNEVPATLPANSGSTLKVVPKEDSKAKALAAVPDLKPASEIPPPEKKKVGRPKKESPNNGQVPGEITAADIPEPGEVLPPVVKDPQAAAEFVESLDPTPTPDEKKEFGGRVRALAAAGALNADLKNYILHSAGVDDTAKLTVGNWKRALGELEAALAESKDKLKEVTKNAPLPAF
jgi:hypothetical protein